MRAWVAVTDQEWFEFLFSRRDLDEVNFWTPQPGRGMFRAINRGELFLFKLKSPLNVIAGGGFFEHFTRLPVSLAWEAFGEKNGAESLESTRQRIEKLRRDHPNPWDDYLIGCIVLVDPFFWPRDLWIEQPRDWKGQTQRGKTYDLASGIGRELWEEIRERLGRERPSRVVASKLEPDIPGRFSDPLPRPRRIGQGTFRVVITDVYSRRCAVTAERALPALEAAHIRPFSIEPEHYVANGILLRSDLHRLFDSGYMTITPQYRAEVSHRIRADFDDGETYLKLSGQRILVPDRVDFRPDPRLLEWHNAHRFRG
jgi:putative restriction endonuclease